VIPHQRCTCENVCYVSLLSTDERIRRTAPLMDDNKSDNQNPPQPTPAEPARPQTDWSESEWFLRWLKLARREKE